MGALHPKTMPTDKLYDTLDEEEDYSSLVALPGHKKLGMGATGTSSR